MKKGIRNSIIIIGIIGVLITLCTVSILLNKVDKDVTKLGKLDQPETKQYSTAPTIGTEEELRKYEYEINEIAKTVTLKRYVDESVTSLTIYSKYELKGKVYSTTINNVKNLKSNQLILQDGIVIQNNL